MPKSQHRNLKKIVLYLFFRKKQNSLKAQLANAAKASL